MASPQPAALGVDSAAARTRPDVSRMLVPAMLACVSLMVVLACIRWAVWSYGSDTGTFAQAIANTPGGFRDAMEGGSHLRFHWSPILAVLWPLLMLAHSPFSLQIAQILFIVLTALPLYAIVSAYAGPAWGTRCALLALLYPPLLSNAFAEFHELAFYPVAVLWLFWTADRARWGWYGLAACAAVLIREDACVDLVVAGIVLGIAGLARQRTAQRGLLRGEPREPRRLAFAGFATAALSAAALAMYVTAVLPRVGSWAPSHFYHYSFADGPLQTALAVLTHPLQLARAVATPGRVTYLLEALLPLACLPFLTRWSWLALPAFAGILLSSDQSVWRMGMHYVLLWVPWLLLASSWALVRMAERSQRAALAWWRSALALSVLFLIAFDPMHPAHYLSRAPYQHTTDAQRAFACVPHDAPVATHDEWYAHEALAYPRAMPFGNTPERFRGYLVYAQDWQNAHFERVLPKIRTALANGRFRAVCTFGSVRVLRATSFRTAE